MRATILLLLCVSGCSSGWPSGWEKNEHDAIYPISSGLWVTSYWVVGWKQKFAWNPRQEVMP